MARSRIVRRLRLTGPEVWTIRLLFVVMTMSLILQAVGIVLTLNLMRMNAIVIDDLGGHADIIPDYLEY